jgi:hypothetical protein
MATPLFSFTTLNGSDPAGHDSINVLIKSIEDQLASVSSGLSTGADTPGSVTTGQVLRWSGTTYANALVNAASLDTGAVIEAKIASSAVTETKIADSAVTSAKIANDTIVNADINSSAGIVDTKLATISTAGKVANSATTAASANGNNTIVQRDASGNFSADTITASLSGTATRATSIVGGSAGSVPYQTGTSATGMLGAGSNGHVLTYNTATTAPVWQAISSGSVTLAGDVTGAANANSIGTDAVTESKIAASAVTEGKIAASAVTYAKLASNAKTYSVATTATTGVYYTSTGYLTSASVSTVSSQNPLVIANHASTPFSLWLPNDIGSAGATITICQLGAASVYIYPYVPGGAIPSINGSTGATYTLGGQYSIVTLVCLANTGSGSSTWIITGDYV